MKPLNILKLHLPPHSNDPSSQQPLWAWIVIFLVSLSFNHAPLSSVSCSPLGVVAVDHLFARCWTVELHSASCALRGAALVTLLLSEAWQCQEFPRMGGATQQSGSSTGQNYKQFRK